NLKVGDQLFVLSEECVKEIKGRQYTCAYIGAKRVYLATHGGRSSSFPLVAIDRSSGKLLWRSQVWAAGGLWKYSGIGFHRVTLIERSEGIIVAGVADDCAYIETFAVETGKNVFRFTTAY